MTPSGRYENDVILGLTGESAVVRTGVRNRNNTLTEFDIAKTSCAIANQLQCRCRAIDSGVLAISIPPLSGDMVLDNLEEDWWLSERWWTKCIENEILCTHLSHPMNPKQTRS
jgi:hypothetical protein